MISRTQTDLPCPFARHWWLESVNWSSELSCSFPALSLGGYTTPWRQQSKATWTTSEISLSREEEKRKNLLFEKFPETCGQGLRFCKGKVTFYIYIENCHIYNQSKPKLADWFSRTTPVALSYGGGGGGGGGYISVTVVIDQYSVSLIYLVVNNIGGGLKKEGKGLITFFPWKRGLNRVGRWGGGGFKKNLWFLVRRFGGEGGKHMQYFYMSAFNR